MLNPLNLLKRGPKPLPAGAPVRMVVLLNETEFVEADDLHGRLFARVGARYTVETLTAARVSNVLSVQIDDEVATLATMPLAYPWHELEGSCATAWWWPGAVGACQRASAHLVVSMEGGGDDAIDRYLRLTCVTAAAIEAVDGIAAFCPTGTVVQPADNFVRSAAKASRAALPLHLWIEFRVQEIAPGTTFVATTGLETFGHREVEAITRHAGREAHHRVFNFANHLLRGGDPKPGTTWGMTPDERIMVEIAKSQWERGDVWRLAFVGDPPPKK
jgi:hypothetical protein